MVNPTASQPAGNGRWIVIAMIALGIIAAATAFIYWNNFVKVGDPRSRSAGEFDVEAAIKELAQLDDDLAEAKRVRRFNPMLDKAKAFIARYPKFPAAYTLLAKVYIELNDWPKAYDELQKSITLASNQPEVHRLAGTMQYVMRDYVKAEEHYQTAQVLSPDDPINSVYLAQVCIRTNRHPEARKLLLHALAMNDKSHEAHSTMCDLFLAQNEPQLALQQIDKALDIMKPKWDERAIVVPYVVKRAEVLRRLGNAEAAMQTMDTMLQDAEMFHPAVAPDVATTWGMLSQPLEAVKFYQRASAADPTDPILHAGVIEWALKVKDVPLARQHLRALQNLDPYMPVIAEFKGRIEKAEKE